MEDNRRTTHSVDDYYPKPSRDEEPSQENLSNRPDAEDTDANDTRADRTDSYGSYADASDEKAGYALQYHQTRYASAAPANTAHVRTTGYFHTRQV